MEDLKVKGKVDSGSSKLLRGFGKSRAGFGRIPWRMFQQKWREKRVGQEGMKERDLEKREREIGSPRDT